MYLTEYLILTFKLLYIFMYIKQGYRDENTFTHALRPEVNHPQEWPQTNKNHED